MKIKLINSSGCDLETFEGDTDAIAEKIGEWIVNIQQGDTVKFVEVEKDDWLDDFNYVGSRHHY